MVTAEAAAKTLMWKLTGLVTEATVSHGIGVLGMPGATAYGGLLDVLRPNIAKPEGRPEVPPPPPPRAAAELSKLAP